MHFLPERLDLGSAWMCLRGQSIEAKHCRAPKKQVDSPCSRRVGIPERVRVQIDAREKVANSGYETGTEGDQSHEVTENFFYPRVPVSPLEEISLVDMVSGHE